MNQKLLSGLTATLLLSTLGIAPSGYADQSESAVQQPKVNASESGAISQTASTASAPSSQAASQGLITADPPVHLQPTLPAEVNSIQSAGSTTGTSSPASDLEPSSLSDAPTGEKVSAPATTAATPGATTPSAPASSTPIQSSAQPPQPTEAIKVGEYQSQEAARTDTTIATIQPHQIQGRAAATLYVRNIPVLTFLDDGSSAQFSSADGAAVADGTAVKVASTQSASGAAVVPTNPAQAHSAHSDVKVASSNAPVSQTPASSNSRDPVWRATATAARLNQLHRDSINAADIKISWNADRQQYVISANDVEIVAVDEGIVLPDTINNSASDVLQATNRIRRQMGGAAPLSGIEGDPNQVRQISLGNINLRVSGYASWYGPGFNGNYSASGEVFNQEAMTAAHPSLPFGTQVRVTNMDNGESVVVRINDRGPYAHGRVIDLSAGAARIIGLIQSGVAPVSLEVLGVAQSASN